MTTCNAIPAAQPAVTSLHRVLVIDAQVDDYQRLVAGVQPGVAVYVLESHQDGVAQITKILQEINASAFSPLELHLVSHGAPGCLYLGKTELSLSTLADYADQLHTWFPNTQGELLLYGCNVAAGDAGAEFLAKLHHFTGANLAASTRKLGQGSWTLDTHLPAHSSTHLPIYPHPLSPHVGHLFRHQHER